MDIEQMQAEHIAYFAKQASSHKGSIEVQGTVVGSTFPQGRSIHKPPLFNGNNYGVWKAGMTAFIQATNYEVWSVIENGPHTLVKNDTNGASISKLEEKYDENDIKLIFINAQAIHILYCGLDDREFSKIFGCTSAREIWVTLEIIYEGTNQVKECKINALNHHYELFKMEDSELIMEMYTRFTNICNSLNAFGKTYSMSERD